MIIIEQREKIGTIVKMRDMEPGDTGQVTESGYYVYKLSNGIVAALKSLLPGDYWNIDKQDCNVRLCDLKLTEV